MNQLRYTKSQPLPVKGFHLYNIPPTNYGIEQICWKDVPTLSGLEEGKAIEFKIPREDSYIDLQHTRLYIKAKIIKENGSDLPAPFTDPSGTHDRANWNKQHDVGPVNLWLHSLFDTAELSIENQPLERCYHYPYKSYMETMLFPYNNVKGETELFYKDSWPGMDSTEIFGTNEGLTRRTGRAVSSTEYDMIGPLHFDICRQDRYLVKDMSVNIKLTPSENTFNLMSNAGKCRVVITTAVLKVCRVYPTHDMEELQEKALADYDAQYMMEDTHVEYFTIPKGTTDVDENNLFQGRVPLKLAFGCVEEDAFLGAYNKNPYNFLHSNVSEVGVFLNNSYVPYNLFKPKFEDGHINSAEAYCSMFSDDQGKQITHDEFDHGFTLFNFTLREIPYTDGTIEASKRGNCSIHMRFAKPTTKTLKLVVMTKFQRVLEINKDRNITEVKY